MHQARVTVTERLTFRVRGSGNDLYKLVATRDHQGFRILCSCPAGRRGGLFCKHVAALLVGDVTRLEEPSDSVAALADMAAGHRLVDRAKVYEPAPERHALDPAPVDLAGMLELAVPRLTAAGLVGRIEDWLDDGRRLAAYARFKNGKLRRTPSLSLTWEPTTSDAIVRPDGGIAWENIRPQVRPWSVRATDGGSVGAWKDLAVAGWRFLDQLERITPRG